jgi:hypothetical protein
VKLFLSPFLVVQQFCRHCFKFSEQPDRWQWWQAEMALLPPMGRFDPQAGFTPDFPVMLMFDEFLIDGEALERISRRAGDLWLGPWPELLQMLSSEGALSVVDVGPTVASVGHQRSVMTRQDLRDPTRWIDAMAYHDSIVAGAGQAFAARVPGEMEPYDWAFDPKRHPARFQGSDGLGHNPSGILRQREEDLDDIHRELRARALVNLKFQIKEVNAISAASAKLEAIPMFWAPYARYLEVKGKANLDEPDAARLFFDVAFPAFRPSTIRQFAYLRSDRRLDHLRDEIRRAHASGDVMEAEYLNRIIRELLGPEMTKTARNRRILGWLATGAGFVASAAGVPPIPAAIGPAVGADVAEKVVESVRRKSLDWLYLISDAVGIT